VEISNLTLEVTSQEIFGEEFGRRLWGETFWGRLWGRLWGRPLEEISNLISEMNFGGEHSGTLKKPS